MTLLEKQEKFMRLYEPVYENLWRFCLALTHNRDNAKDLLAETTLTAYESFEKLRDSKAFLSFMFTIASRTFRKERNRKSRMNFTEHELMDTIFSSEVSPEDITDVKLLYETLDQLAPVQKEAIILFEIFGFTREEIAKIQDTTVLNIKMRLYRGRNKLSGLLKANRKKQNNTMPISNRNELTYKPASLKGAGNE